MNILMWPNFFYPKVGGVATVVENLGKQLVSLGINVVVVTEAFENAPAEEETTWGGKVFRIAFPVPESDIGKQSKPFVDQLEGIILSNEIDLIHIHLLDIQSYYGNLLIRRQQRPLVLSLHGSDIFHFKLKSAFVQEESIRIVKSATQIISCSYALGKALGEHVPNPPKVRIIPNGVDLNEFSQTTKAFLPEMLEISTRKSFCILAVGRLVPLKGFDLLIKAIGILWKSKKISNIILIIVGDGEERENLQTLVDNLGLTKQITFVGQVSRPLIVSLFKFCDLFVIPSRTEGFGLAMLEAMAAGKPIIGTRTGGIPEILQHEENGWLVPPDNPEALSEAILYAYYEEELRQRFGSNNREKVLAYDWNYIVKDYISIYFEHIQN